MEMLGEAKKTIEHGMSIMMFPEGTRSKTGELGPFKDGAFQLAIDAGTKILPLALKGTRDCLPKGSFWVDKAHATVQVLPRSMPRSRRGVAPRSDARLDSRRARSDAPGLKARQGTRTRPGAPFSPAAV